MGAKLSAHTRNVYTADNFIYILYSLFNGLRTCSDGLGSILDTGDVCFISFCLCQSCQRFSNFTDFPQRNNSVFHFLCCFPVFNFIHFCFYVLSINFELIFCSYSNLGRDEFRLSSQNLFFFLMKYLML